MRGTLPELRSGAPRVLRARVARRVAVALAGCAIAPACLAASAQAATGHKFLGQLVPPAAEAAFAPEAVALDTSGNVFLYDSEAGAIDTFNSSGVSTGQFGAGFLEGEVRGIAVDKAGRVYVADTGKNTVEVFKPSGFGSYAHLSEWTGANTPEKAFSEVGGVAVNAASAVYVLDRGASAVYDFTAHEGAEEAAEGAFVSTLTTKLEELTAIAVRPSTGQIYLAGTAAEVHAVEVLSSAGVFEAKITGKGTKASKKATPVDGFASIEALAVEDSSGDIYVADGESKVVEQMSSSGEWLGWLTGAEASGGYAPFTEPHSVAVASSGKVYVSDGQAVDFYGPNIVVPDAVTEKVAPRARTTATFNGTINTNGTPTQYFFEYGPAGGTRTRTPVQSATEGESAVQAAVEGLEAGKSYEVQLITTSKEGTRVGATLVFETLPAVNAVTTLPATAVGAAGATLNGSLKPEKLPTKYRFEYGETASYGKQSPVEFAETNAGGVVPVESAVTALKSNTTYHFRLVAFNQFGTTFGADETFKTTGPSIVSKPTQPIGHTSATVNAEINTPEAGSSYRVEYGTSTAYGTATSEKPVPAGKAIAEELTGLKLATTYHFRVVVLNAAKEPFFGPDQEFTTVLIGSESATEVSAEGAVLRAQLAPLGADTKYHFEYGTTTSYGTQAPVPDGDAGKAAEGFVGVEAPIAGLQPQTTYHYRVSVTVEGIAEVAHGEDRTFTTPSATAAAANLPDGRAYELVSPPEKHGGYIEALTLGGGVIQSSEDGSGFAFVVDGPIVEDPEGNRSPEAQQALSTRGSGSWSAQELVTPHDRPFGLRAGRPSEYEFFSGDLALSLTQPFPYALTPMAEPALAPPSSEAERGHQEKTIYVRNDAPVAPSTAEAPLYEEAARNGEALAREHGEAAAKPGYVPLVSMLNAAVPFGGKPINSTAVEPSVLFLTASPDLTHSVLRSTVALAKTAPSAPGLYESSGGQLELVSVLPNGQPATGGTAGLSAVDLGSGFLGQPTNWRNAISNDGRRISWTVAEGATGAGELFMRDTTAHKTLRVDVPTEAGLERPATGEALFQAASSDGSKIFFTDAQRLTTSSTAQPGKPDLYECEVGESAGEPTCKLSDVTRDEHAGESAAVQGLVLGAAADGSSIYYVASGALATGAQAGARNLYAAHHGAGGWTTHFLGALSAEDNPDWGFVKNRVEEMNISARVSPNGRYLAFMSKERLTNYNNTDVNEVETEELVAGKKVKVKQHADEEVFLYDAGAAFTAGKEGVTCESCNPSGARPRGVFDTGTSGEGSGLLVDRPETWSTEAPGTDHWLAGSLPGWTRVSINETSYQSRYLSDQGRLFFNSADALVQGTPAHTRPEVVGGLEGKPVEAAVGVENVYQSEPNGLGGCSTGSRCLSLISSGTSEKESAFLDASVTGDNVFFLTAAKLLSQDRDSSFDIYDARICTGESPCQTPPPAAPPQCASAAECRGSGSGAPGFQAPPSSTFNGPGSPVQPAQTTSVQPKPPVVSTPSRTRRLAAALKKCRRLAHRTKAQKHKRASCESKARRHFAAKKALAKHARRRAK